MTGPYLLIFCGLPFAGKTTLAKELVKRFGFTRVDIDEIKEEFGFGGLSNDDISDSDWDRIYSESYKRVREALAENKVVIDDTANFTRELRDKLRLNTAGNYPTKTIYFEIPKDKAIERMKENRKSLVRFDIPDKDFFDVADQLEIPTVNENVIIFSHKDSMDTWVNNLVHL